MATDVESPASPGATPSGFLNISRPAYTSETLKTELGYQPPPQVPLSTKLASKLKSKCQCSGECLQKTALSTLPFIDMFRTYQWKKWILSDIIAGVSVGVIHIPQGMGFAVLTNLKPVYGLYASIFPVWLYFLFGTSRHISVGTMALISLMIGAVVTRETPGILDGLPKSNSTNGTTGSGESDEENVRVGLAMSVSLLMGAFQFVMWLFRLDVLSSFMSMSFNQAFMTGAALQIITSQVTAILGLSIERPTGTFALPLTYVEVFKNITQTNVAALITALICILLLVVMKIFINDRYKAKLKVPIPAELVVVVLGTAVSYGAKFHQRYGMSIVNEIPRGLPTPQIPPMTNVGNYIVDAIILAILGFAISISMAKIVAKRQKYAVYPNQEVLAYSLQNGIGALFGSFGGAQAPPRTLVCESTKGKTQLAGLISSILPLLVCLALGPLFEALPYCVLASIIVVALLPLLAQFAELPALWKVSKVDFSVWVVTVLFTVIFSIPIGLVTGIGLNILLVVVQAQLSKGAEVGAFGDTEIYTTVTSPDKASPILIYRLKCDLFFVNVEIVKNQLIKAVKHHTTVPEPVESNGNYKPNGTDDVTSTELKEKELAEKRFQSQDLLGIVLDCSAVSYIDLMGINLLKQMHAENRGKNVKFVLAACSVQVIESLEKAGALGQDGIVIYPTLQDAVALLEADWFSNAEP